MMKQTSQVETATQSAKPPVSWERFWLAGIPVDVISREQILEVFQEAVIQSKRLVLANVNLHGLYCALRSGRMRRLLSHEQTIVHIDGTPILWAAHAFGVSVPANARNGHIDLIPVLFEMCARKGWQVVIVNSNESGAIQNERVFSKLVPGLKIKGITGYFDIDNRDPSSDQQKVVSEIKSLSPKLLLVGMGMPRQEEWILSASELLEVPMIMPVGGFADYFTGRARIPPRRLGPLGLEWLYRLVYSPKRLGFRYLIEPMLLTGLLLRAYYLGTKWGMHDRYEVPDVEARSN